MDRRGGIAAAVALVLGFGLGWLVRGALGGASGVDGPAWGGGASVTEPAPIAGEEGSGAGAVGADGGASPATASSESGPTGTGTAGTGDVAVIGDGLSGGSGATGDESGGGEGEGGAAADRPAGDGGVGGVLDAAAIQDVVREHRDQLGFCFAWQLHQHPELGGRLTMEFEIGPDGHVQDASVIGDTVEDETVARCFLSETRRMEFPPPEGGGTVTVRYPFDLSAGDPEE